MCGLQWSHGGSRLASGGNDNQLNIWNGYNTTPELSVKAHTGAVKVCTDDSLISPPNPHTADCCRSQLHRRARNASTMQPAATGAPVGAHGAPRPLLPRPRLQCTSYVLRGYGGGTHTFGHAACVSDTTNVLPRAQLCSFKFWRLPVCCRRSRGHHTTQRCWLVVAVQRIHAYAYSTCALTRSYSRSIQAVRCVFNSGATCYPTVTACLSNRFRAQPVLHQHLFLFLLRYQIWHGEETAISS